jgi:hypothetical protein
MLYNWKGHFAGDEKHPRIPARDLTKEEVKEFGKRFLLKLGYYEEVEPPKDEVNNDK